MATLTAAEIQNTVTRPEPGSDNQRVDYRSGVPTVLKDIAVCFQIELVENDPPPVGPDMRLEILDLSEAALARQAWLGLRCSEIVGRREPSRREPGRKGPRLPCGPWRLRFGRRRHARSPPDPSWTFGSVT